jgi:prepilin-type N-terminal cleavage/methylation domain-containing protein
MKYFSPLISHLSFQKGFSLVELLISVTIFAMLIGIITLNLNTAQHKATISTSLETLLTDLNQQQIKAMVGDTEGRTDADNYGIHFDSTSYTLFHGTYSGSETTNFSIILPTIQQITTTFPSSQVIFQKGSGNVVGFDPNNENTITLSDTVNGEQKVIELNRFGVVTAVN